MTIPKTLDDLNIKNNNDIVASKIQIKSNLIKSIKRGDFDINSKSRKRARKNVRKEERAEPPSPPGSPVQQDAFMRREDNYAALNSWATDIVNKVNAGITNTCLDANGQAATNKQPCNGNATECRFKEKMHEHLRNPILRNILDPPAPNDPALPPPTNTAAANKGLGWLRIPTSTANMIDAGWGADEGQHGFTYDTPYNNPEYSNLNATIDLLIAKKFTKEESIDIHNTLMHDIWKQEYPTKLSTGKNFVFTKGGHISIELPSGVLSAQSGTPKKIFLNPMTQASESTAPTALMNILQQSCSGGSCTQTYSMASNNQDNGVFDYSAYSASNGGKQLLFAMGAKVVMNKALTYILYTPIAQNKLDELKQGAFDGSAGNVYYLLYNPIHQNEFKDFFRCHMQSTRSGSGSTYNAATPYYTAADTSGSGIQDPYKLTDRTVQDGNEGCLDQLRTDPYNVYIARYCNAFKVPGLLSSAGNEYMTHFADPTCAFTMSKNTAKFTFVSNYNVSDESRREKFYKRRNTETDRDGYDHFKNALTAIDGSDYGLNIWACPSHPAGETRPTIMNYLSDLNQYSSNSTSFVQDLGNAILNSAHNQWIETGAGGGRREIQPGAVEAEVKCHQPVWNITRCNMEVEAGAIEGTFVTQNMACGPQPYAPGASQQPTATSMTGDGASSSSQPSQPSQPGDGTDPVCRSEVFIPPCADCVTAGTCTAGDAAEETPTGIWQACCYHNPSVLEGNCPVATTSGDCGSFGNTIQSNFHQGVRTAGEKERLETQVGTLYKKVALATEVATTSRTAYKDDPKIKKIVRKMMEDAVDAQGKLDTINELVELMDGAGVHTTAIENVENKITEVITIINRLEEYEGKLIVIIEENYFNGIKKTYIFAAVAAFVLLSVVVLIM